MRVRDLIERLQEFDADLAVCVDGYEGGVTEDITVRQATVFADVNEEWFFGEHAEEDEFYGDASLPKKQVVLLARHEDETGRS